MSTEDKDQSPTPQDKAEKANQDAKANDAAKVSQADAEDMARRDYISHVSKDGRTLVQRVTDAGYANWTAVGENIASGMETWHDALLGWEQSKEHRANLLSEEFQDVGLGSAEGDDGRAQVERVQQFQEVKDQVPDGQTAFDPPLGRIELREVSVAYSAGIDTFKHVTAEIPQGSLVALVGPSGSGKTTFLGMLMRFMDPGAGSVTVNGRDLRSFTFDSWRKHVALVTQAPLLFNASVVENVRLGRLDATEEEVMAALRGAALDPATELPHLAGGEPIGEAGALLSGGQQQRLTIARALVRNAMLLLLDEATSSLDREKEMAVLDGLAAYCQSGSTIIFSTHRIEAAGRADIVFSFEAGQVRRIK